MDVNGLTVLYTSIPGRYARALFNEGKRTNCLDKITDNFKKLELFLSKNVMIKKLLTSGYVKDEELDSSWLALSEHLSFCPVFISFIRQVVINRRFGMIDRIRHVYRVAIARHKNRRSVAIMSAVSLLPEQKEKIDQVVKELFTEKCVITYNVNPKILGGLRICSEEMVYDASVYSQLKQIYKYFKDIKIE